MTKELVVTVEIRVRCSEMDGFDAGRTLDACREAGSAAVIDMRVEEVETA